MEPNRERKHSRIVQRETPVWHGWASTSPPQAGEYSARGGKPSAPTSGTKRHGTERSTAGPSGLRIDEQELLAGRAPDGHDEPAARLELLVERVRDSRRGGSDGDRGEGRVLGEAERPVADVHLDAAVARRGERLAGPFGELGHALDRVHLAGELGEHGRLVARAGADVEHALAALQRERLADPGDHVGLRDRLARADRQRRVLVRAPALLGRDEELARHLGHRREHALVHDVAAAELLVHHPAAGYRRRFMPRAERRRIAAAAPRRSGRARAGRRRRCSRLGVDADGQHRHLRVAGEQRAVAAAAAVVAAGEVGELPAGRGGDEHVAGVRVREGGPGALERVGAVVEERRVASTFEPPSGRRREAELPAARRATASSPSRKSTTSAPAKPSRRSASARASAPQPGSR